MTSDLIFSARSERSRSEPAARSWQAHGMAQPIATTQRTLVLLRHAKSAWPDGVPDTQRPLNDRGRRDAGAAGRWLRDHVGDLAAVACSPATRARQTWELVSAELADAPTASFDERIYAGMPDELLAVIRDLPDTAPSALLIGHNPGVEELVELLSGQEQGMSTASVAVLTWEGGWTDADAHVAQLRDHAAPRG
jgi:phosphohistidine phosphatase